MLNEHCATVTYKNDRKPRALYSTIWKYCRPLSCLILLKTAEETITPGREMKLTHVSKDVPSKYIVFYNENCILKNVYTDYLNQ